MSLLASLILANASPAHGKHFGFRGGFRGGYASGHHGITRHSAYRSTGYRGFSGFNRSRYNALGFRSRRYDRSGFNRVSRFHGSSRFGFPKHTNTYRLSRFHPVSRSVAYQHLPAKFHNGVTHHHKASRPIFDSHLAHGAGWDHLANGHTDRALSAFTNQLATSAPEPLAHVGYAVALANAGRLAEGIAQMRKAITDHHEYVFAMMMDESLRPAVQQATHVYEQHHDKTPQDADTGFMLAVMYQMQGDPEMAAMAMRDAQHRGANDAAAKNLAAVIEQEVSSAPVESDHGWELMTAGKPAEAAKAFVGTIEQDVTTGAPKLGFALATAMAGDLDHGAWAMRRAFSIDPEGASDVMLSGELRPVVEDITAMFEERMETETDHKDTAFMLASLYQLQGDVEAARMMLNVSEELPESFLAKMITEETDEQIVMMKQAMAERDKAASSATTAGTFISVGNFQGKSDHAVSGGLAIAKTETGYELRLRSDFSLDGAPDPKLAFGKDGFDSTTVFAALEATTGQQVYSLPDSITPTEYNEVWIWCEKFSVPLAVAKLHHK